MKKMNREKNKSLITACYVIYYTYHVTFYIIYSVHFLTFFFHPSLTAIVHIMSFVLVSIGWCVRSSVCVRRVYLPLHPHTLLLGNIARTR